MPKPRPVHPFQNSPDDNPVLELGTQFGLGPKSSQWLYDAGIRTKTEVVQLGPIEVCRRILDAGHPIAVIVAYALHGGLIGRRWDQLPEADKLRIKKAFQEMKQAWKASRYQP